MYSWIIKHQVHDAQQKKAKYDAFNGLDKSSAFSLQDFAQKVLPVNLWKGQREYFGKKGWAYLLMRFLAKKDSQVRKKVCLTAIYRCDQAMKDVKSITDALLGQFKLDNPLIEDVCMSSQTMLVATMGH